MEIRDIVKKVIHYIKYYFMSFCICNTMIISFFALMGKIMNMSGTHRGLDVNELGTFLALSALIALSLTLSSLIKFNSVIKGIVRILLCYGSFAATILTSRIFAEYSKTSQNPAYTVLVLSFAFILIYALVSLFVFLAKLLYKKIIEEKQEYTKQF